MTVNYLTFFELISFDNQSKKSSLLDSDWSVNQEAVVDFFKPNQKINNFFKGYSHIDPLTDTGKLFAVGFALGKQKANIYKNLNFPPKILTKFSGKFKFVFLLKKFL